MKLRQETALALVVWYLMGPPTRQSSTPIPLTDTPMSEWQTLSSWETQRDCEGALKAWRYKLSNTYMSTADLRTASGKAEAIRVMTDSEQERHSVCIASDDHRLK